VARSPDQPSGGSNVPSRLISDYQIVMINQILKPVLPLAVARWYGEDTDQGKMRFSDPLGDTTEVNNMGEILKQYGGYNIIYQQGSKGKLTQIGEFGKSINLNGILGNILKNNQRIAKKLDLNGFYDYVKSGGKWDYKDVKVQAGTIFGAASQFDKKNNVKTGFRYEGYRFKDGSDIGNYNYGYVGGYVGGEGYNQLVLWYAAGAAQIKKDFVNEFEFKKGINELSTFISGPPFGDEHDDFIWTTRGKNDAENEKEKNNEEK
jgi:hypothetical protein